MSMSRLRSSSRTFLRATLVVVAGSISLLAWASPALAHVDFVGSTPSNLSTVSGPVSQVVLEFTGPAAPIDDDFKLENPSGTGVAIRSISKDGDAKVVVTSAAPLANGRTKLVWALRGADGHKMSGSVSFTVVQAESVPPSTSSTASGAGSTAAPSTIVTAGDEPSVAVETSTDEGLAEALGVVARWVVYGAILLTVGALAYLQWVHRGTRREGRKIVFFIRRAAVLIIFGAVVEWFAQLAMTGSGSPGDLVRPSVWGDLLSTGFALGTLTRIIGAALVLRFVSIDVVPETAPTADLDWIADPEATRSVLVEAPAAMAPTRVRVESGPLALVGTVLLVISESFIGHTASVSPRALMAVSDAVHLTAAGIWAAGAWLLAVTLWNRHRRHEPLDASLMATRFSLLATWSLVAVAISGCILAWAILDGPSAIWGSEFGRLLLVKTFVVIVIGCFGLHNRRVLVPALVAGDESAAETFRRTIAVEAVLFVAVLLITSFLVIANPLS